MDGSTRSEKAATEGEGGDSPRPEELWSALAAGTPELWLTLDLRGRITWLSRAPSGLTTDQLRGRDALELVSEEDRAGVRALFARVAAGGPAEGWRARLPDPGGGTFRHLQGSAAPVRRGDRVVAVLVQARNVTEAQQVEGALAASEERFRALIEHNPDAICLFDEAGILRYANRAAHRLLDVDPETLFGADGWNLFHPDDREAMRGAQARILALPGQPVEVPLFRLLHRDGSWRWIESVAVNLLHVRSVRAMVSRYRDVTARVQLEEQLRQAQKMEAIGLLAGGVAHDFNNLLTVILGSADNLALALAANDPLRAEIEHIDKAARSAAELTQKLLTFSRRQVRQRVPLDLRRTMLGFGTLLRRIVGEDVQVQIDVPESLPMEGDGGQLQQLLLNLVTNARQAMPRGGTLRLVGRRLPVTAEAPEGLAEVEVSDTGVGMDAATRARLFEPFFTTRPGGTGLGMPVVLNVVQDHRGRIEVDSEPGRGTTVRVLLPLHPHRPAGTDGGGPRPSGGAETILFAEDEPLLRDLLSRALRAFGYTVLTAADGVEALALFEREGDRIAAVVLDLIMPRLGGREVLAQMRATRPELRAVLITGHAPEPGEIADLLSPGRVTLMHKPFLGSDLAARVRNLIDAEV